jgi:glutamine amidotransferase
VPSEWPSGRPARTICPAPKEASDMPQVAVIDYNAGNVRSVEFALRRLGVEPLLTFDEAALRAASHVIFPGVGEASSAMGYLKERGLDRVIPTLTQPVLGICLGLQLLCRHSEEADTECLGVFDTEVRRFRGAEKVPQIGWNTVHHNGSPLFDGIDEGAHFYFVHSFYAEPCPDQAASTEYILPFASALERGNFHAVQFHPEKSADVGSRLLQNFMSF